MKLSLGNILAQRAAIEPATFAFKVLDTGESLTFAQYDQKTNQIARVFSKQGIKKGDRVALLMVNSAEFMQCFFACAKLGAIGVPINLRLVSEEIKYILQDSGAKTLVYSPELSQVVSELYQDTEINAQLEQVLCSVSQCTDSFAQSLLLLRDEQSVDEFEIQGWDDDLCMIMYTSGTTGHPKGVMHSHKNFVWALISMSATMETKKNDRFYSSMPMFHIAALMPVLLGVYEGYALIVEKQFDPSRTWQRIEQERISTTLMAPVMLNFMLQVPEKDSCDISSLQWIMSGAAPVPVSMIAAYQEMGIAVHQVYGMTENLGPACVITGENATERKGSCGKAFMHTEVRVVDANGNDVKSGESGEVVFRGENIMSGYWQQPEATKESIRDGWLHTGDGAKIDAEGYIYIADRLKDMIISGGENVYPAEIENLLIKHSVIKEAAVVGKPDEKWGEVPVAFVVKTDDSLTENDVLGSLIGHLAKYKIPTKCIFIDAIPRNAAGKVLKKDLRALL
ncbi:o-succinylbenzoate--CoA ligase [Colwellia sp. MEBiC06753]